MNLKQFCTRTSSKEITPKIGMRVQCLNNYEGVKVKNLFGVICHIHDDISLVGVEFYEPFIGGHTCDGACTMPYTGLYMYRLFWDEGNFEIL